MELCQQMPYSDDVGPTLWTLFFYNYIAAECPGREFQYHRRVNMCYWFKLDDEVTWIDAKDDCLSRDSFLITVGKYHYLVEKAIVLVPPFI